MRGVMLDVPAALLAERARLGHDRFDEMWEGELHMVPPPSEEHQRIGIELAFALRAAAAGTDLAVRYETGVFDPGIADPSSYRQPDLVVFGPAVRSERGVEGAAGLVVEIVSPGDESVGKIPFYERVGVAEVLLVDRDTKELRLWSRRDGRLVERPAAGRVLLATVPLTLAAGDGHLVASWPGGRSSI